MKTIFGFFLNLVPWWGRALALIALCTALIGFGWVKGSEHDEAKHVAAEMQAIKEGVRIMTVRGEVTTKIETVYVPQIAKAQVITETIIKEVPVYVPTTDPDLSAGFRVLHDAAANGTLPDPASVPDAAPVAAQTAAETVAENYGACIVNAKRLEGLQEWVRQQQQVK